jgi:hypothetical protein
MEERKFMLRAKKRMGTFLFCYAKTMAGGGGGVARGVRSEVWRDLLLWMIEQVGQ